MDDLLERSGLQSEKLVHSEFERRFRQASQIARILEQPIHAHTEEEIRRLVGSRLHGVSMEDEHIHWLVHELVGHQKTVEHIKAYAQEKGISPSMAAFELLNQPFQGEGWIDDDALASEIILNPDELNALNTNEYEHAGGSIEAHIKVPGYPKAYTGPIRVVFLPEQTTSAESTKIRNHEKNHLKIKLMGFAAADINETDEEYTSTLTELHTQSLINTLKDEVLTSMIGEPEEIISRVLDIHAEPDKEELDKADLSPTERARVVAAYKRTYDSLRKFLTPVTQKMIEELSPEERLTLAFTLTQYKPEEWPSPFFEAHALLRHKPHEKEPGQH